MSDSADNFDFRELDELLEHQHALRNLARRLVDDDDLADDLVQDVGKAMLDYRRGRDSSEDRERIRNVPAWMRTVLRHKAATTARRAGNRRDRERSVARPEEVSATADLAEREALRRALSEAVLDLAEPYRSTVLEHFYHDRSSAEMAREAGISAATVRSRLKRGLEQLRASFESRQGSRRAAAAGLLLLTRPVRDVATDTVAGPAAQPAVQSLRSGSRLAVIAGMCLVVVAGVLWLGRDDDELSSIETMSEEKTASVTPRRPSDSTTFSEAPVPAAAPMPPTPRERFSSPYALRGRVDLLAPDFDPVLRPTGFDVHHARIRSGPDADVRYLVSREIVPLEALSPVRRIPWATDYVLPVDEPGLYTLRFGAPGIRNHLACVVSTERPWAPKVRVVSEFRARRGRGISDEAEVVFRPDPHAAATFEPTRSAVDGMMIVDGPVFLPVTLGVRDVAGIDVVWREVSNDGDVIELPAFRPHVVRIVDAMTETPIADVLVEARINIRLGVTWHYRVVTAADGTATVAVPELLQEDLGWLMRLTKPGYVEQQVPGRFGGLFGPARQDSTTIALMPRGVAGGEIRDELGEPLAGQAVYVTAGDVPFARGLSDRHGRFRLDAILMPVMFSGDIPDFERTALTALADDNLVTVFTFGSDHRHAKFARVPWGELENGTWSGVSEEPRDVEIEIVSAVTDEPIENAEIIVDVVHRRRIVSMLQHGIWIPTDAGCFLFEDLHGRDWAFSARAPGYRDHSVRLDLDRLDAYVIRLQPHEDRAEFAVDVVLHDPAGRPLPDILVSFDLPMRFGGVGHRPTDAAGRAHFDVPKSVTDVPFDVSTTTHVKSVVAERSVKVGLSVSATCVPIVPVVFDVCDVSGEEIAAAQIVCRASPTSRDDASDVSDAVDPSTPKVRLSERSLRRRHVAQRLPVGQETQTFIVHTLTGSPTSVEWQPSDPQPVLVEMRGGRTLRGRLAGMSNDVRVTLSASPESSSPYHQLIGTDDDARLVEIANDGRFVMSDLAPTTWTLEVVTSGGDGVVATVAVDLATDRDLGDVSMRSRAEKNDR